MLPTNVCTLHMRTVHVFLCTRGDNYLYSTYVCYIFVGASVVQGSHPPLQCADEQAEALQGSHSQELQVPQILEWSAVLGRRIRYQRGMCVCVCCV